MIGHVTGISEGKDGVKVVINIPAPNEDDSDYEEQRTEIKALTLGSVEIKYPA